MKGTTKALALALAVASAAPVADAFERTFDVAEPGEVVAIVRAGCGRCAWGDPGREAAALRIIVDGKYSQHLLLARGETAADYRVTLGALPAGRHRLSVRRDPALSAKGAGPATIAVDTVTVMAGGGDEAVAQSMAPILHARPNTVGKFTDLPILMWYEIVPTSRGRQFRYSVIFTNEDGGTATDRLMATWGRTTDIEFVYGAELDAAGRLVAEQFQGPGHQMPGFDGRHEGRHPLLWVSTDNNMVSASGPTRVRYAPAPERFDLANASREVVMDRHPWSYVLAAEEMAREGKIAADPPPHSNKIPDPRRYVTVEACGEVGNAALAVAVGLRRSGRVPPQADGDIAWIPSDRGVPQFRIVRDGCFRAGTPLPAGTEPGDITGLRVLAFERAAADGKPPLPAGTVRLTRVNTMFMLDEQYLPRPSMLQPWRGDVTLRAGGPPFQLDLR
jgi:hypothetical protein